MPKENQKHKHKFVVWLSIFLSLLPLVLFSAQADSLEKTSETVSSVSTRSQLPDTLLANHQSLVFAVTAAKSKAVHDAELVVQQQQAAKKVSTASTPKDTGAKEVTPPPSDGSDAEAAIAQYFGDIYQQAYNVAYCESTLRPTAINKPNYGLFQINSVHSDQWAEVTGKDFYSTWSDPYLNAQFARWLYDQSGGWGPWGCRWAANS